MNLRNKWVSLASRGLLWSGLGLIILLSGCATPPKPGIDSQQIHKDTEKSFQELEKEEKNKGL